MNASYLKIFLGITLTFGLLHVGSLLVYLYSPTSYYHGPMAYFRDIAFRVEGYPLRWVGMEYHDQTRDNLFLYQYGREITVTVDDQGFRARRYDSEHYPIAIAGDSTIYGNRLNDNETLPWLLAEALEAPVFNGGHTPMSSMLAHPAIDQVQVVFDGITERAIFPRILKKRRAIADGVFEPIAKKDLTLLEAAREVPPGRYSAPLMLLKIAERFAGDLKVWASGERETWRYLRHRLRPEELDETVAVIVAYKKQFDARGIRYVFLPIPAKQNLYADNVDDYTRNFIPVLAARLRAEGVEVIDLYTPFEAHKEEILFFHFDTHWNEKGTALAARVIAREIFGKN